MVFVVKLAVARLSDSQQRNGKNDANHWSKNDGEKMNPKQPIMNFMHQS